MTTLGVCEPACPYNARRAATATHLAFSSPLQSKGVIAQNFCDESRAVHRRVGVHGTDDTLQLGTNPCSLHVFGTENAMQS